MLSRLQPPSTQAVLEPFIFSETRWLGGDHDGYPLVSFENYLKVRQYRSQQSTTSGGRNVQLDAARFQALLTFGLLEAILEEKIPEAELVYVQDECERQLDPTALPPRVLRSRNIPSHLSRWRRRIQGLGAGDEARHMAKRMQTTLRKAHGLLMLETLHPRYSLFQAAGLDERDIAQILLQIGSLAEALVSSSYVFATNIPRQGFSWTFLQARMNVVHKDMLSRGWCPFTVPMLSDTLTELGYVSVTEPVIRESSAGHGNCSEKGCVINTLDYNTYEPQHAEQNCNCQILHAKRSADYLSEGKVPVIQCQASSPIRINLGDASGMPYVAISHVWADGLGSTAEKGLPSCQVKRLSILVESLMPGGAFWIDSLCVPENRDVRKEAIRLMALTYRNAAIVLVIDSGIRSVSISAPRETKLLRVVSSGWMQRLWTLQEAVLAKKLVFEFRDGLVSLEDLVPIGEELFSGVTSYLASEIYRLKKHRETQLTLSDVARGLCWRTSSKPGDETLAISGLLNVDALELANLPATERMARFLHRVYHLPAGIIFLSGPKLTQEGFTWAPRSFMRAKESSIPFAAYDGVCTPSGLVAQYLTLNFQRATIDRQSVWAVHDVSQQRIYKITDIWLDDEAKEMGYPSTYECDHVLLPKSIAPSDTSHCVAVLELDSDDQTRVTCRFQKRLIIQSISHIEFGKETIPICLDATLTHLSMKVT
ncbi:uncharacterized protein N7479_003751 [Penicillium vulpinum]|uniref:Heterokaryon incompatibility domain-containing protein n=1 Tax=Penicillium vulpinum TaxID=29845 RepID=A0A1V6RSE7_9EURO|nr:uncharacterized protein N7479_003751 [Penicillium vulpinum]KAJ5963875.1 hypothetical protein N7479_003751 [Penicillium vulpinum]OQE04546.1 hypothetical protein PENVUL_c032G09495 [Penicillium vulpinum]